MFFPEKPNAIISGYRTDIDSLRAFAVLAVIFYHFNIELFKGGFVGVDIFFVISGYLITKGIISLREKNKFSIGEFYVRRARRLLPAIIVTIAATYVMGFFFFSPVDFMAMSGSTVYALSGISNLYFWMDSGYFDNFSSLKPLLHTWSLSVELQFYLVWPFVLLTLLSISRKACAVGVILFTIIASAVSIHHAKIDSTSAFFLTPFRMQEFSIGAVIVFIESAKISKMLKNAIYITGVFMIAIPVFTYDINKILFPGYFALIPCLGAALMIMTGDGISASKFFSAKPVSHIGEISYSLYLTHWPIYVFTSYFFVGHITNVILFLMVIVTFTASLLMYKFIERPFRNTKESKLSGTGFSLLCCGIIMIIIIPAASSWANKGWEWRLPESIRSINSLNPKDTKDFTWKIQEELTHKTNFDQSNKKTKLLIIGDSQSADVINMINESGNSDKFDIIARTIPVECGTPFIPKDKEINYFTKENSFSIKRPGLMKLCKGLMQSAMDENLLRAADKIVIAIFYYRYAEPYIANSIDKISSLTNAEILLFGRKNLTKSSVDIVNSLGRTTGIETYASNFKDPGTYALNKKIKTIKHVKFIDMMDIVCPSEHKCLVLTDDNQPIFFDPAHLSRFGAKFLGEKIIKQIQ